MLKEKVEEFADARNGFTSEIAVDSKGFRRYILMLIWIASQECCEMKCYSEWKMMMMKISVDVMAEP